MLKRVAHPNVLCFSGHDPTGGAGVQADVEAIAALGGHALGIVTAYTVQDTRNVRKVVAPPLALLREQVAPLLRDVRVHAIKIGLLGEPRQIPLIVAAIRRIRAPVVLDPVLRAGGGRTLAGDRLVDAIRRQLLPHVDLATPNESELLRLAGVRTRDEAAQRWLEHGAGNVLVTGGDAAGAVVTNTWYRPGRAPRRHAWPRLPGGFHGAGCTLAAAVATLLGRGLPLAAAIEDAQAWTRVTLQNARRIGRGRPIPWRQ